jgi:hypothetical protein
MSGDHLLVPVKTQSSAILSMLLNGLMRIVPNHSAFRKRNRFDHR